MSDITQATEPKCQNCGRVDARGLCPRCQEHVRAAMVQQLPDPRDRRDRLPWVLDSRYGLPDRTTRRSPSPRADHIVAEFEDAVRPQMVDTNWTAVEGQLIEVPTEVPEENGGRT